MRPAPASLAHQPPAPLSTAATARPLPSSAASGISAGVSAGVSAAGVSAAGADANDVSSLFGPPKPRIATAASGLAAAAGKPAPSGLSPTAPPPAPAPGPASASGPRSGPLSASLSSKPSAGAGASFFDSFGLGNDANAAAPQTAAGSASSFAQQAPSLASARPPSTQRRPSADRTASSASILDAFGLDLGPAPASVSAAPTKPFQQQPFQQPPAQTAQPAQPAQPPKQPAQPHWPQKPPTPTPAPAVVAQIAPPAAQPVAPPSPTRAAFSSRPIAPYAPHQQSQPQTLARPPSPARPPSRSGQPSPDPFLAPSSAVSAGSASAIPAVNYSTPAVGPAIVPSEQDAHDEQSSFTAMTSSSLLVSESFGFEAASNPFSAESFGEGRAPEIASQMFHQVPQQPAPASLHAQGRLQVNPSHGSAQADDGSPSGMKQSLSTATDQFEDIDTVDRPTGFLALVTGEASRQTHHSQALRSAQSPTGLHTGSSKHTADLDDLDDLVLGASSGNLSMSAATARPPTAAFQPPPPPVAPPPTTAAPLRPVSKSPADASASSSTFTTPVPSLVPTYAHASSAPSVPSASSAATSSLAADTQLPRPVSPARVSPQTLPQQQAQPQQQPQSDHSDWELLSTNQPGEWDAESVPFQQVPSQTYSHESQQSHSHSHRSHPSYADTASLFGQPGHASLSSDPFAVHSQASPDASSWAHQTDSEPLQHVSQAHYYPHDQQQQTQYVQQDTQHVQEPPRSVSPVAAPASAPAHAETANTDAIAWNSTGSATVDDWGWDTAGAEADQQFASDAFPDTKQPLYQDQQQQYDPYGNPFNAQPEQTQHQPEEQHVHQPLEQTPQELLQHQLELQQQQATGEYQAEDQLAQPPPPAWADESQRESVAEFDATASSDALFSNQPTAPSAAAAGTDDPFAFATQQQDGAPEAQFNAFPPQTQQSVESDPFAFAQTAAYTGEQPGADAYAGYDNAYPSTGADMQVSQPQADAVSQMDANPSWNPAADQTTTGWDAQQYQESWDPQQAGHGYVDQQHQAEQLAGGATYQYGQQGYYQEQQQWTGHEQAAQDVSFDQSLANAVQPSFEQPTFEQPAFEQPAFEQPAAEQPQYEQPQYDQSAFEVQPPQIPADAAAQQPAESVYPNASVPSEQIFSPSAASVVQSDVGSAYSHPQVDAHILCPNCSRRCDADANFCGKCGTPLQPKRSASPVPPKAAAVAAASVAPAVLPQPPIPQQPQVEQSVVGLADGSQSAYQQYDPYGMSGHQHHQTGLDPSAAGYDPQYGHQGQYGYDAQYEHQQYGEPYVEQAHEQQYHDQQYQHEQYQEQQPEPPAPFVDPLGRSRGHAIASFGFGGKLLVIKPKRMTMYLTSSNGVPIATEKSFPGELQVHSVKALLDDATKKPIEAAFDGSGPLLGAKNATKKKKLLAFIDNHILKGGESSEHLAPTGSSLMLWQFVRLLIEHDGALCSSSNPATDAATIQAVRAILHTRPQDLEHLAGSHGVLAKIHAHLLEGNRLAACQAASAGGLWAHALIIASNVSREAYADVVAKFSQAGLRTVAADPSPDTPLPSLNVVYGLFGGLGKASVLEFLPGHGANEAPTDAYIDHWRHVLTIILANRTPGDATAIVSLGEQLMHFGRTAEAHVCFMLARIDSLATGVDGQGGSHGQALVTLVGANHIRQPSTFFRDPVMLYLTEAVEYACTLTGSGGVANGFPHLQAFKFWYATYLSDLGYTELATKYVESIINFIKDHKGSPYLHQTLGEKLRQFADQLAVSTEGSQSKDSSGSARSGAGSWLSKLSSNFTGAAIGRGIEQLMNNAIVSGWIPVADAPSRAARRRRAASQDAGDADPQAQLQCCPHGRTFWCLCAVYGCRRWCTATAAATDLCSAVRDASARACAAVLRGPVTAVVCGSVASRIRLPAARPVHARVEARSGISSRRSRANRCRVLWIRSRFGACWCCWLRHQRWIRSQRWLRRQCKLRS
ncbi:Sec23-binding domain of Sec16-domain-containing protein [Entophlyctis helioformis]|nr:Sec23-binding domain of Sec16-domain-containing protein [Entophlyctis helioformis]